MAHMLCNPYLQVCERVEDLGFQGFGSEILPAFCFCLMKCWDRTLELEVSVLV